MNKLEILILVFLVCNLFCYEWAICYKTFQALIPNGNNVPDPCSPDKIWGGLGHYNKLGGGARNPFGMDFLAAGKQWTMDFCRKDSDGDGKTNGEELGDPNCSWQVGQIPSRTTMLSHPGFCEPYNSPKCLALNSGSTGSLQCDKQTFNCPAINTTGVWSKEYRFMPTRVPAKKTTYICLAFESGYEANSSAIHKIALQPIIDNANVLHHILLYGCSGNIRPSKLTAFTEPYECLMGASDCFKIIAAWSLGSPGNCLSEKMGILMNGAVGYNRFVLQLHWNNPTAADNLYDSSGVKLYFEQKRRPFDGGVFILGQQYLELQPGKESIVQDAVCTKPCTQTIMTKYLPAERSIFFTTGFIHMHGNGVSGYAQLYRNGIGMEYLIPNKTFRYDTPEQFVYPTEIEYKSGDELKMQCLYNTKVQTDTIYYGEATSDEMCYAFLQYYPSTSVYDFCINYGIFTCELGLGQYTQIANYARANYSSIYDYGYLIKDLGHGSNCSVFQFFTNFHNKWQMIMRSSCSLEAADSCRAECRATYDAMVKAEPCFSGWPFLYMLHMPYQYGIIAPNNGKLFHDVINEIQMYAAPCRTEYRMRMNMLSFMTPNSFATQIPQMIHMMTSQMLTFPIFIGILIGLGVLIILLVLVTVSLCIRKNFKKGMIQEKNVLNLDIEVKNPDDNHAYSIE